MHLLLINHPMITIFILFRCLP